jgi:hypothetical protein
VWTTPSRMPLPTRLTTWASKHDGRDTCTILLSIFSSSDQPATSLGGSALLELRGGQGRTIHNTNTIQNII